MQFLRRISFISHIQWCSETICTNIRRNLIYTDNPQLFKTHDCRKAWDSSPKKIIFCHNLLTFMLITKLLLVTHESRWLPATVWLPRFFKIFFWKRHSYRNNIRVSKCWLNFRFQVNYPFSLVGGFTVQHVRYQFIGLNQSWQSANSSHYVLTFPAFIF